MKPTQLRRLTSLWPVLCSLATSPPLESAGQTPRLDSPQVTNGMVTFNVIGFSNLYYRVDVSTDARNWLPIDAYQDNGLPHAARDLIGAGNGARFYRAVNTDPALRVFDLSPASGPPATQVTVIGQFFPPPSQLSVSFGSVSASVISGTSTRLMVQVPTNAVTSQITVTTRSDSQTSSGTFVVQANAVVTFTPPAGISAQDFEINNNYGTGVPLASPPGAVSIPVRVGSPNLTYATPINTNLPIFFCAVSVDASQPISMTATSTAEALVFQNAHLMAQDPDLARAVLAVIHTNADVQAFAQVLAQTMVQTQAPLTNPAVNVAYQTAVASVVNGSAFQPLALAAHAAPPTTGRAPKQSVSRIQIYQLESPATRFLEIHTKATKVETGVEDFFYNPVDWLVMYQKVEVDKAFPNGRKDFDVVQRAFETIPQSYPLDEEFEVERSIKANHVSSRLNVVSTLAKTISSALVPKFIDESVTLPSADAMYLVRGVGPALRTPEDVAFVDSKMADVRGRVMGLNLMSAAVELLSVAIDDEEAKEVAEKASDWAKLAQEALTEGPGINTIDDFERAVYVLANSLIQDLIQEKVKDVAKHALEFVAGNALSINAKLKTASAVGQLVERASGLFRTTALETSFVVVGDPFALQIIRLQPRTGAPGQDIIVEFKGSPEWRPFDTNNTLDNVTFEGTSSSFYGQVTSVSGPDELGIQTLTLQFPPSVGNTADGPYTLFVNTQGRRGSTPFTLSTAAALTEVTPTQGFAAAANFIGSPFPGTRVHLQGALFTTADTFLFPGGIAGVKATNKTTGGASSGDVYVYVPAGAISGPVQVLHPLTNGTSLQITGPVFTVLGPPQIQSIQPSSAPPGLTLSLSVSNIGVDASMVYAQFTGLQPSSVAFLPNSTVTVIVPSQAQTGPLAIITPAGTDQVPLTVLPPVPFTGQLGAGIQVGGDSPITLNRAITLASGNATPVDGPDDSTDQNPHPPEEGDYVNPDNGIQSTPRWALGPLYQNRIDIAGTNTENADFLLNYDSLTGGGLAGNIIISGHNNTIGPLTFLGPVTVTGYSNRFTSVTFLGPATLVGSNNSISQSTVSAPMTVLGDGNQFNWVNVLGVTGNGLTIQGNRNVFGGISVLSNSADGVVINGGKYNNLTVNQSSGNGGNGVTLTGGAVGNVLAIFTKAGGPQGGGNHGHGVALIGAAVANQVTGNLNGNGLDGVYLDGSGVIQNQFNNAASFNGRNGFTITNGAHLNQIGDTNFAGSSFTIVDQNTGSGAALMGCGENVVQLWARTNGLYGVLVSGVQVHPNGLQIMLTTSGTGLSNGRAGLRLEQGTSGVHALGSRLGGADRVGVELDGADVTGNLIEGYVFNAVSNGVVLHGAHNNELAIWVENAGADGLLLQGASNNVIRLESASNNASNGVHVTFGSYGNRFTSQQGAPFSATIRSNLNGVVFDSDSHDNVMELTSVHTNRQDGLVFSGASRNEFVWSEVREAARDGIRFENGAQDNVVGSDTPDVPGNITYEINVEGCGAAGVHMTGPNTHGNILRRCFIASSYLVGQPTGVLVDAGCDGGLISRSTIGLDNDGVVVRDAASNVTLVNLTFSLNTNTAITITNASAIRIGGPADSDHNEFIQSPTGVDISGPGSINNVLLNNHIFAGTDAVYLHDGAQHNEVAGANLLENSGHGVRIEAAYGNLVRGSVIRGNQSAGILIARGATNNSVEANTILNNAIGVLVTDSGTIGNSILGNSITHNTTKGIQLINGGNAGISPPVLLDFSGVTVGGTAPAADGSRVEIFSDPGNQGQTWLGAGLVQSGHFHVPVRVPGGALTPSLRLNGTVTDPQGDTSEFSASFNPASPSTRLAFTSYAPSGNRNIYLWDGASDPVNLTQSPADNFTPNLGSLSGCNLLLFVSRRTGNPNIFVMPALPGAPARLVITNSANNYDAAWLINCQSLVFASDQGANSQIYSVNLDGTGLKRLTTDSANDYVPKATADGSKIVFMSDRSGKGEIYLMNADGSNQRQVSNLGGTAFHPAVSPDGSRIAFARGSVFTKEIWTITADGNTLFQVTADGADAAYPAWMPDGQHLVFSSTKNGGLHLFTISSQGGTSQPLPITLSADEPSVGLP